MGLSEVFRGRRPSLVTEEAAVDVKQVGAKYAPDDLEPIRQIPPTGPLSWLWNRPKLFAPAAILGWAVLPFLVFLVIGVVQGTLVLSGDGHGVLESTAFLTYFPTGGLLIVLVYYATRNLRGTLNSVANLARFEEDTTFLEDERYRSSLTKDDLDELFRFYEYVLANLSFRGSAADVSLPGADSDGNGADDGSGDDPNEDYARTYLLWFRIPYALFTVGAFAFFLLAAEHHWNAVETYGFRLWSSQEFLVGFAARTVYDFMLYVLMGPFVAVRLLACIYLLHHVMTRLQRENGIRFLRFAIDEAGGFGKFGTQSLKNVFVLLPFTIPIAVSIVFLPVNELTLGGIVVFLLCLPLVFFWPLLGARRSMKRMKQMELEIVGDSLLNNYEGYRRQLVNADTETEYEVLTDQGEAIERAETIFNGIKNQPAWPFSKTLIGQFLSLMTILSGALLTLLESFAL